LKDLKYAIYFHFTLSFNVAGHPRFTTSQMVSKTGWTEDAKNHLVWVDMEVVSKFAYTFYVFLIVKI
jgi:hypothetical protein